MNKYSKHLISFLLIFGLTVNECAIYTNKTLSSYYQVLFISKKTNIKCKQTKLYRSSTSLSKKTFSFLRYLFFDLKKIYASKTQTSLKIQTKLHQKVRLIKAQQIFLGKIITSSNKYSDLYIS